MNTQEKNNNCVDAMPEGIALYFKFRPDQKGSGNGLLNDHYKGLNI